MIPCPNCGFQNAERAKVCGECGQNLGPSGAPVEVRRTVTVLFADVSGSTALGEQLDPESLRAVMGRYFAAMKDVIERHGGTVEKFVGDAVMAVFGIPSLHEDDVLRAVRAAAEIRDVLAGLNEELQDSRGLLVVLRTGVNTGEVAAGDPSAGQTLVTGDTVNTAARLEQAARPGEILIGQSTFSLVRDAVVTEPAEPIDAKGKAKPVPAYRLVSVTPGAAGQARLLDAPMVGRDRELHLLTDAFDRSVADISCQLATVLGAAGVGKSRLVHEFRQQIEGQATVLVGRCLSYGEGITYWPLAEALRGPVGVDDSRPVESWRAGLMALIAGESQAEAIVDKVMGLIGVGDAAGSSEAFWAVRRLLEGIAQRRPLVFVIEDLHWATPTFLDLIEHLAGWTRDASITLVCLARPELLDVRPGWGSGNANAATILLEPLDDRSIDRLLGHLLDGASVGTGVQRRIAAAAEGNPLFVEELVAMLAERGELADRDGTRWMAEPPRLDVPPTIEALLAARIDQLPRDERAVLGRASVVGRQFGVREVAYLSDASAHASVRAALMTLVRRDLLRPDPDALLPLGPEDEAFQFRHQLIRDGAYAGMSKIERARLHERYGHWLEDLPDERLRQLDEVIGYHFEQAHALRAQLGGDPGSLDTARVAARHLAAAGLRAWERDDAAATANLLARAATLLPPADPDRIALLPTLARGLIALGHFDEALVVLNEAIDETSDGSDQATRVTALVVRSVLAGRKGASSAERMPDIEAALAIAELDDDLPRLAFVRAGLARVAMDAGRLGEARRQLGLALDAAQRSGDLMREADVRGDLVLATSWGSNPGSDIDRVLADNLAFAREHSQRVLEASMLRALAVEAARRGRIPQARRLMAECLAILEDLGGRPLMIAAVTADQGYLEFLAGDHAARERLLREGYEQLGAMGERGVLSSIAADLADALFDLGRLDEADAMCAVADEAGAEDDVVTQVSVRLVRGRLSAARGSMNEALSWVGDAVALADQGEFYDTRTQSRLVVAQLLLAAGRIDEARARAQEVLDLAGPRGDVVSEARAKDVLKRGAVSTSSRAG